MSEVKLKKCDYEDETFKQEVPELESEEVKCSCGCGKTVGFVGKKKEG